MERNRHTSAKPSSSFVHGCTIVSSDKRSHQRWPGSSVFRASLFQPTRGRKLMRSALRELESDVEPPAGRPADRNTRREKKEQKKAILPPRPAIPLEYLVVWYIGYSTPTTMGNLFSSLSVSAAAAATASLLVPSAIAFIIFRRHQRGLNSSNTKVTSKTKKQIELSPEASEAKERFLSELSMAHGDTEEHRVHVAYEDLSSFYDSDTQAHDMSVLLEGMWKQLVC